MTDPTADPQFGIDGCTCIPFTRQTNPPRYLNQPTDTVDMISGWERGADCPHHAPAPPPAGRAALRDRMADEAQQQCPGVETVPNRCTCGCEGCKHHCGAHDLGEAQQQDGTETQPPRHRWMVETRDAVADEWAPGMRFTDRSEAVARYRTVSELYPEWRDGTAVERRLVRETTTFTVEDVDTPAVSGPRAADDKQDGAQPGTETQPESCAYCGNTIRRITGTLTEWWVHVPGGHAMCQPWQPARSTRATPQAAAGARQDGAETDVPVHACPGPNDNGISPCCKRPPFEFRGERITRDPALVTCQGPRAEEPQS